MTIAPVSQSTPTTLQLSAVEINPFLNLAAIQGELQHWTPCYACHKFTEFKILPSKDVPCTFQCHGLKLRGWSNPKILHLGRNDVYNLKASVKGQVTHGAGSGWQHRWASSNPPEVWKTHGRQLSIFSLKIVILCNKKKHFKGKTCIF